MTERGRRPRASRRELRAWAWVAGGLALVAPWAVISGSPPPAAAADGKRPVTVIRRITRRVIITQPAQPADVRYVYASSPSGSSSSSSSSSSSAPPPTTSTGGS